MNEDHKHCSAGNAALVAEADGVLSVGNAMDMSISGAWAFIKKARDALAAIEPQAVELTIADLFKCDEAACHEYPSFYEQFDEHDRGNIIRAILRASPLSRPEPK